MRTPIIRVLFILALAVAWLTPSSPIFAQAALGENSLSYTDQDFISQLYQEVVASQRLAGLALNFGQKGSVRSLAASTSDSLRQIRETVKILARKKGVTVTDELIAQNQDVVDQLSSAGGDGFDRNYLDILLRYLPRIQDRCESVASTTQDPDLKALTSSLVPTIKARIEAVETVKAGL
jgi:predicted outer membrane protein